MNDRPTPEELRSQITAYEVEKGIYQTYAQALERVLKTACRPALPAAVIQSRAKSTSSFAEKCARKWMKTKSPALDFTDLCGGRVVVQTLNEVEAVRAFVEVNFRVVETEDIGLRLGGSEFGYRDRHYIIQLLDDRAAAIGFSPDEIAKIGGRKAELQIRTWAQHAWADTLHDRTYKSPVKLTAEARRMAALLAALMEDGDRNFDRLANELDGIVTNYSAYAERTVIENEISLQKLLADGEKDPSERVAFDFHQARLHGVLGRYSEVISLLEPHVAVDSPLQDEVHLELGSALCRKHRADPASADYQRGLDWIAAVAKRLSEPQGKVVLNLRRRAGLRARALSHLAWASEALPAGTSEAGRHHRQAVELEPKNPYYLANLLGFELRGGAKLSEMGGCMRPVILEALQTCEAHASQELELPFAYFTAGRLRLLLGDSKGALHDYLRGANHCLSENSCCGSEVIDDEVAWFYGANFGKELPKSFQSAANFLLLAKAARGLNEHVNDAGIQALKTRAIVKRPVLIIAGGAGSMREDTLTELRKPLTDALANFAGTVISGGTKSGLPGLVGEVAAALKQEGRKHFTLLGYRPETLPDDAPRDPNYEQIRVGKDGFSEAQILANWADILAAGVSPSEVRLLGVGGGDIAAIEYRMALAIGANTGLMPVSKEYAAKPDAVDSLLADTKWNGFKNLLPLPFDGMTLRAFVVAEPCQFDAAKLDAMAAEFHERYRADNLKKIKPDTLKPWAHLPDTYRTANIQQAAYAIRILEAAGFGIREAKGTPVVFSDFKPEEIELMAELEHGRWNVERLRDGWRYGPRDDDRKTHHCLVPWIKLPDGPNGVKRYDRDAVRAFPTILGMVNLEVFRP